MERQLPRVVVEGGELAAHGPVALITTSLKRATPADQWRPSRHRLQRMRSDDSDGASGRHPSRDVENGADRRRQRPGNASRGVKIPQRTDTLEGPAPRPGPSHTLPRIAHRTVSAAGGTDALYLPE